MSPHPTRNVSEDWFRASEATGDFMGIRYGRISKSGEVEWFHVSHCECDGIGGFARLLREQGVEIPKLPETKHPCRGVLSPLWRLWRHREREENCAVRGDWLPLMPAEKNRSENAAWHLFTEEETQDIVGRSREQQCTVNSCLLHCLDQTVREEIRSPAKKIPWIIPVNLRGDVRYGDDAQNYVSGVEVRIAPDDSAQAIHRQILQRLKRGEHRANHLLLNLGGMLSHQAKVRFLRKDRAKPAGNIGAFSNLGVWDFDENATADGGWVFCPPIVTGQRLSAGCVTFQGRLGLATQGISAQERMARWVRLVRSLSI